MNKLFALIAVFTICLCEIHADEKAKSAPPKYNLSICAIFKNEAPYLREWLEYHRLAGVDHFYLYNNGSSDHFMRILSPYIRAGIVTLIHWPDHLNDYFFDEDEKKFLWSLSTQIPIYENATQIRASDDTKWLIFLDIDEFLVSSNDDLKKMIEKYEDYPAIMLLSDFFDCTSAPDALPKKKLLIETVALTAPHTSCPQREVTKLIFKPDQCKGFTWPPYKHILKDSQKAVALKKSKARINHYENRNKFQINFNKRKDVLHVDNRKLSAKETDELLKEGYEIQDQECLIQRFVPKLLKRLGY